MQAVKFIGDIVAVILILFIIALTFVSVLAIWKVIVVDAVISKSMFSFSILLVSYFIITIAIRYWELRHPSDPSV